MRRSLLTNSANKSARSIRLFNPPPGSGLVGDDHLLELADETVKNRWIE
jgi:hypothetical protein